jgi:hypothetical protein
MNTHREQRGAKGITLSYPFPGESQEIPLEIERRGVLISPFKIW